MKENEGGKGTRQSRGFVRNCGKRKQEMKIVG